MTDETEGDNTTEGAASQSFSVHRFVHHHSYTYKNAEKRKKAKPSGARYINDAHA